MLPGCELIGCGGNGVLLLDGVAASVSGIRMLGTLKDGFDVKGEGTVLTSSNPIAHTLPPTPCTLHLAPCTLHPAPCTLHPVPCTLHPAPCTLHPTP